MTFDYDHIVFKSTGRRFYAYGETIGIRESGEAMYGWDGDLEGGDETLTKDERRELSDHMIAAWKRFAEAEPTPPDPDL